VQCLYCCIQFDKHFFSKLELEKRYSRCLACEGGLELENVQTRKSYRSAVFSSHQYFDMVLSYPKDSLFIGERIPHPTSFRSEGESLYHSEMVKKYGLRSNLDLGVTAKQVREFLYCTRYKGILGDVSNTIMYFFHLCYDFYRTNELRSDLPPRLGNWDQQFSDVLKNAIDKSFFDLNLSVARNSTIGIPMYLFVLKMGSFSTVHGLLPQEESVFFAVNIKDNGLEARLTHSVPSALQNVNHVGVFNRVVGHNPEPIDSSCYPYSLSLSEWTVFRLQPGTIDDNNYLLWFTVFDRGGLISSRPLLRSSSNRNMIIWSGQMSDVAASNNEGVVVLGKNYSTNFLQSCLK